VLGILAGGIAVALMARGNRRAALGAAGACALIFYPVLVLGVAPQLKALWISERVAALVARDARPGDPPLVAAGYAEPSLLFELGGATRLSTGKDAANITATQGGLALIEDAEGRAFLTRISELGTIAVPVGQLSGFDYSRGHKEHMTLFRIKQVPQEVNPPGD
jgi:hypothetical protein